MNSPKISDEAKGRLEAQLSEVGIPAGVTDEIVTHHTLVNYDKGAMLFLQGSPADLLFWVFNGWVKVYCPGADGRRIMVKLAGPSDLVGHIDYIDGKGRKVQAFEAQAHTRCSAALFTREHAVKLQQLLDHATLLDLIERLNTAWSSTTQWFGTFLAMSFRERLEMKLRELGANFGVRDARGVLLMPELTHPDLAEMIGSSRPMVSRLLGNMIEEGLLRRQGKQYILLKQLAGAASDSPRQRNESSEFNGFSKMFPIRSAGRPRSKVVVGGASREASPQTLSAAVAERTSKGIGV